MDAPTQTIGSAELPPPSIQESPETQQGSSSGLLNPARSRHTLTILVGHHGQTSGGFTVTWAGAPGTGAEGSYTTPRIPFTGQNPQEVRLDTELVTFNLGRTAIVTYTVYPDTGVPLTSQPLIVYVLPIAQGDLTRPLIKQADMAGHGVLLDMNNLTDFTLWIDAWLLSRRGQFYWVKFVGTAVDDSVFEAWYWLAEVIDDEFIRFGFVEQIFPAAPLLGLKNRSVLRLEFMAGLERSSDLSRAQPFAHRNYIVLTEAANAPRISSVTDLDGEVADGADTRYTSVTLSGSGFGAIDVFDGPIFLDTVNAVGGIWTYLANALTGGLHSFMVRLADGSGGTSSPRRINVVVQNLEVTIAEALDNGNVDPLAVLTSLTAVVNYDMQPNDRIRVRWTAAPGTPAAGSHTTNTLTAGPTRPRRVPLPLTLVAFSLGKRVTVSAEYDRGTAQPVPLGPIHLNVGMIPADRFIPPVFLEANGTSDLFLASVQGGATLRFGVWPLIARLQALWLDLEGEDINGAPHNLAMWTGNVTVNQSWVLNSGYSVIVLFSYLKDLRPGSTLTLRFRVNLDTVANKLAAQAFVLRQYTIR
ncbi:hypothetical protein M5G22_28465 [Pseudomonas sp. TNT2022 ID233]|uniref:hypothetical protein n=1 Tax=Pseudomonas aphyarum TaxID=2942629 RepID=UPI0023606FCC|nr:hypothetical protein [Pseudomonas aphyarum]MDD1141507.1 hypothetical protein [Pseudomonas aphyarum]